MFHPSDDDKLKRYVQPDHHAQLVDPLNEDVPYHGLFVSKNQLLHFLIFYIHVPNIYISISFIKIKWRVIKICIFQSNIFIFQI